MAIQKLPEAQAAYSQSMASLDAAHSQMNAIAAAKKVDWGAYQAALDTCDALQKTAQAALGVFEAALLDTPTVADLKGKLATDTASMKARTAALSTAASTLTDLTSVATDANGILTTLSRFEAMAA